jgi:hypothetical protein
MLPKQSAAEENSSLFKTILWAGFLAGALDIAAAMLIYYVSTQKNPLNILPFIASGVFGKEAFNGETEMIIWGFLLHFLIAYFITASFFLIYPKANFLRQNNILTAIFLGLFVWCVMNLIVLPLSKAPEIPFNFFGALRGAFILIVAIGMPLSFIAYNYYVRRGRIKYSDSTL